MITDPQNDQENTDSGNGPDEMSFLEHLEELRWRIIKSAIGVIIASIVVGIFINWIMDNVLLMPATKTNPPLKLQNIKPFGQFTLYMEVIIFGGIILSIPNLIYQFWKFIEPALNPGEGRYIKSIVIFSSFCFIAGNLFAYFVLLPSALEFFASFGSSIIDNIIAIDEYFSFVISTILAAGLVFELPMISFFLSKVGILKPEFMRKYRKHAIILILLAAGILTPSPDVTSQILLAGPLFILYEISIFICKFSQKKKPAGENPA
ncbi:MAG TPA: twin-arginine translocase subunit TatC [Ignavibacteria bacterium]|nr:twin-arginine translocase subunit TatC [Ignavibacteria bacterium]HQY52770.1 twin-arginine translocase subunit TatC [Ignavibacteria bacterium]HRB00747.1 twin-arginine translocase subunit TatC [Ignavibacteria bacterium]